MDLPLKVTTRLYDSIDMPLSVWIDALVDGNTDKIKDFGDRFAEFCEAIGGRELMIQLDNIIEMTQLRTKIQIAELCMNQLRIIYLIQFMLVTNTLLQRLWWGISLKLRRKAQCMLL